MSLHHAIVAVGLLSSLCGFALLLRFGFRFHSRLRFDGTMPAADRADPALIERHNDDVKGRFGFTLVVLGTLLLAFSSYCPKMPV